MKDEIDDWVNRLIEGDEAFRLRSHRTVALLDEGYYLSIEMNEDLDDEQALAIAEDELATMNGLGFVRFSDYRPVRVSGVSKLDSATGKITTSITLKMPSISSRVRLYDHAVVVIGPEGTPTEPPSPPVPQESPGDTILNLAASNDALEGALFLYGKVDHNWRGLYMVLEAIEDGNGGEDGLVKKTWGGERVRDFKKTSNSYKALGPDARHGSTRQGVEAPKLTLTEARQLIRDLLSGWIAELRS